MPRSLYARRLRSWLYASPPPFANQYAASSRRIWRSVRDSIRPLPFVVRSSVTSCETTTLPSLVTPTSSSSMSAPAATERLNAYSVFDGNSSSPPWWAMLRTRSSSQGFGAWAAAGVTAASARISVASGRRTRIPRSMAARASAVEVALPAVGVQPLDVLGRQPAAVAGGRVALDVADRAHAGDHGRDGVGREHIAQRGLRDLLARDAEVVDDRLHAFGDLLLAVAVEVARAEVALGELTVLVDRARQAALVERDAREHADVVLLDGREQLVLRALVEDVVDHLHGVDEAGADEGERRRGLVVVDRHAEVADLALLLERVDRLAPVALLEPVVVPDVELLHVDRLEPEVAQAGLRALADVRARERV